MRRLGNRRRVKAGILEWNKAFEKIGIKDAIVVKVQPDDAPFDTQDVGGRAMVDLKLGGTAIYCDVARLYALAHGVPHTGTRERFEALAPLLRAEPHESQAWVAGFEYLQMLRLQAQMARTAETPGNPNLIELRTLNDIDRRMLKETMRIARSLQQQRRQVLAQQGHGGASQKQHRLVSSFVFRASIAGQARSTAQGKPGPGSGRSEGEKQSHAPA